uniref:Uncharacterized protein n=1 Tax=Megaselia scalaris TaxID=36166 RepID=T1GXP7_MEGSC
MVGSRATATVTGPPLGPMTSEKFHLKWDSHLPHLNNATPATKLIDVLEPSVYRDIWAVELFYQTGIDTSKSHVNSVGN